MALLLKSIYFLVVIALQSVFSEVYEQESDDCHETQYMHNAMFGQSDFLAYDQQAYLDTTNLLLYQDNLQCNTPVSLNCLQCEGPASIFCNMTASEDVEYLKNSQPIPHLYLNLDDLQDIPLDLFVELSINTLELVGNYLNNTNLYFLNGIKNLSTLVLRGQFEEDLHMAEILRNLENLTNLIMDFSEIPTRNYIQDLINVPPIPGRRNGLLGPDSPEKPEFCDSLNSPENPYNQQGPNGPVGPVPPRISDSDQGLDDPIVPGPSGIPDYHNGPGEYLQPTQTKSVDVEIQRNISNEDYDRANILPNVRVYSLISGMITQMHLWLGKLPIKYLFFHKCDLSLENITELLSRLQYSLQYLYIDDSFLCSDNNTYYMDDLHYVLEDIILAIKDFQNRTILKGFTASNMGMKLVPYEALTIVKDSLHYLSLYGNDFSTLRASVSTDNVTSEKRSVIIFPTMPQLLELDLRLCSIEILESGAFANLPNLKVLLLTQNHIHSYNADCFRNLHKLQYLDMSLNDNSVAYNGIKNVNFTFIPKLEILDLSQTNLDSSFYFCGELRNLKKLFMCNAFSAEIDSNLRIFETLPRLELLNLSRNNFKGGTINIEYFSGLETLKKLYLVNCFLHSVGMNPGNASLSDNLTLQPLKSLKYLDMSQNQFSFLHINDFVFFENLEFLILENCGIEIWTSPIFFNLTHLKYVNLNYNLFSSITSAMLQDFSHLQKLSILGNKFKCGCEIIDFVNMVNQKSDNNTFLDCWLDNSYQCADEMSSLNIPLNHYENNDCYNKISPLFPIIQNSSYTFVVYLVVAVCIFLITISVIVYYKWHDIRYLALIIKDATILSFSSDNSELERKDRLYNYDVFVSYSEPNRNWVLDELIPNLEMSGNLKVCLHERDFQIGLSILENIIYCMDNSKSIMLIISLSFIKSNWCQFELHLAQHRLLETKREHLILVLLEDVPHHKRSKMLNFLMKTKTYIIWPPSEEDQDARKLFWKRIRQAVVIKTKLCAENSSLA